MNKKASPERVSILLKAFLSIAASLKVGIGRHGLFCIIINDRLSFTFI